MSGGEKAKSTIVVKRVKKGGHGAHGAAWKIAYADFVTAMMAFFLLMWLLGSTTKGDLKGIEEYFQSPLQVSLSGGSGSGDATSIINGGGTDLTKSAGQVKRGEALAKKHRHDLMAREEKTKMEELAKKLNMAIEDNPKLSQYRDQIKITITPDGLKVQIVDDFKRPMFDMGGAHVKDYMRDILREFGKVLDEVDRPLVLTGHTDSAQYSTGDKAYSNWELSADRANASRRELIAGGLAKDKVVRVVGMADSNLLDSNDPKNPLNRRISIIVLNKLAEERMKQAGGEIEAGSVDEISKALDGGGSPSDPPTGQMPPEISGGKS